MAEELKKFQTVNLADYYNQNGSQYSTLGDITPYSAGGTKFDNTSPIEQGLTNLTPLDDFISALQDPERLSAVQEKSGIEVFPLPITEQKIGVSPEGFNFIPAFTTETPNTFNFIPAFETAQVTNNIITPQKQGVTVTNNIITPLKDGISVINTMGNPPGTAPAVANNMGNPPGTAPSVTNNMGNPPGTAPSVTNNMTTPNHGFASLIVGDFFKNVHARGFIDRKGLVNKGTDFIGILGDGNPLTYLHQGGGIYESPNLTGGNFYPDYDARGFVPNKHHSDPSDFIGITGEPGNMLFNFSTVGGGGQIWAWNRSNYNDKIGVPVDGFGNQKARGFILDKIHKDASDFKGVSFPKPYAYPADPSPFQSYGFTDSIYSTLMDNTSKPTAPGAKDGVGQSFDVSHQSAQTVTGKKFRFADGIELQGEFKTKVEDLYASLPLQDEAHNSGFYGTQPYVTRDIGSNWSLFSDGPGPVHGDSAVRGGVGTSLNRAIQDVSRIGQYLLSPNGLIFIAKNVGMQLSNPKYQVAGILGLARTRIYPLALSTIAQVAVNAAGLHLVRHGLGPLEGPGTNYETGVKEIGRDNYTKGTVYGLAATRTKSRLYALGEEFGSGYFDKDTMDAAKPKTEGKGFFAKAVRWTKKQLQKLTSSREKIDVLSGLLGPHSLYGIGRTRIFRSDAGFGVGQHTDATGTHGQSVSLTTSWANVQDEKQRGDKIEGTFNPKAQNPNFANNGWTPKEGNRYSDAKNDEGNFKSEIEPQIGLMHQAEGDSGPKSGRQSPSLRHAAKSQDFDGGLSHAYESIAYGKIAAIQSSGNRINDFREYLTGDVADIGRFTQQPNNGDEGSGPAFGGMDRVTRFKEDYGKPGVDRSNRLADLGLNDKSVGRNAAGMPEPVNALNSVIIDNDPTATEFPDLILFQFKVLQEERNTIQFRAMLTDMTDTLSPQFEDVGYVGRTTPTYLFKSIARETKFSFKLYAMTRQELDAQYKRLNRLMQSISPGYTSGNLPIGPILKLTIGNYFRDIPVVCDSFDISIPDSSPWDIDEGRQLPLYLEVSMGCKIMFNEKENYDPTTGKFKTGGADESGKFPAQVGLEVFKSTSNYFNGINFNFGRGESDPVTQGE